MALDMDKTPVTLLHEYLQKKTEIPEYKLIHNGVGTHDPIFLYQVSGQGKKAEGSGKSKKAAKHSAALSLLTILKELDRDLEKEDIKSPYDKTIEENAVGNLLDFCYMHQAPLPKYELIRDEGLAHAKIFGFRCTLSSFVTKAEARTKKQAKQLVSHYMLQKLQTCIPPEFINADKTLSDSGQKAIVDDTLALVSTKVTEEGYFNKPENMNGIKLGSIIIDYPEQFIRTVTSCSEELMRIKDNDEEYFKNLTTPFFLFETIMSELNYNHFYTYVTPNDETENKMCCLKIIELNLAQFIGLDISEEKAKKNAVIKALTFMALMSRS